MPILVRNTPPGYDWAFYSREEPRMRQQTTLAAKTPCKVWLEAQGRWLIEASGELKLGLHRAARRPAQTPRCVNAAAPLKPFDDVERVIARLTLSAA